MVAVGLLLPVLLVAALVGGFYLWARRQEHVPSAGGTGARHSSVSVLTEAVAYVGAVLVLGGGIAAVGQRWNDISDWGHVALLASGTLLFLVAGVVLRDVDDDAIRRLVSVLWLISVGGLAAAVAVANHEVYRTPGTTTLLATGLIATAYAAGLWSVRRHALQDAALFGALVVAICGVIAVSFTSPTGLMFALSLWAFGLAWAALGWARVIEPMWVSMPLGILLALLAPSFGIPDHGWLFALAIATAAMLMAASVPLHNTPLLGVATVSMFGYLTAMLVRYFEDSLGVPAALAIAGLLILGLAVVSARLMKAARPPSVAPAAAAEPTEAPQPQPQPEPEPEPEPRELHHV